MTFLKPCSLTRDRDVCDGWASLALRLGPVVPLLVLQHAAAESHPGPRDSLGRCLAPHSPQQLLQFPLHHPHHRRPVVHKRCVHLHERGSSTDLLQGITPAAHPTHADDGHPACGQARGQESTGNASRRPQALLCPYLG